VTEGPQKALIYIYRSTEEHWWHKTLFVDIYLDGRPFIQLKGGEYVMVYLPSGTHSITVEYDRYSGDFQHPRDEKTAQLDSGDVLYAEIVPSHQGTTWVWDFPSPVPVPLPGAHVQVTFQPEEKAREVLGRRLDRDMVRERKIFQ
jgi:hypothetical protein